MELKEQKFGIEIEMTGITRAKAAEVTAGYFGTRVKYLGTYYDTYAAIDTEGRQWKFMSDSSITAQQKLNGRKISAGREYQTEMVSPICRYEDIVTIQEIIRKLKEHGALTNGSCGIHVHINAEPFDARTLRNITNIMAAKEDLISGGVRGSTASVVSASRHTIFGRIKQKKTKEYGGSGTDLV